MLSYLAEFENIFGPFRLFRYLTLRAAFAGLSAMSIGFILGPWIFSKLRQLRAKQAFRGGGTSRFDFARHLAHL